MDVEIKNDSQNIGCTRSNSAKSVSLQDNGALAGIVYYTLATLLVMVMVM